MAKLYKAVPGADDIPRFKFSNWWNGFEQAAMSLAQGRVPSGQEHIDEHALWTTALLAESDGKNKAGNR